MNKPQREKILRKIMTAGACRFHVYPERRPGETIATGHVSTPDSGSVRFTIYIDDEPPMIHWHGATARLDPAPFLGNVNPCHGTKATSFCRDWDDVIVRLQSVADAAARGDLFEREAA